MKTCTEYNGPSEVRRGRLCRSGHCWPTCSLEQTRLIDLSGPKGPMINRSLWKKPIVLQERSVSRTLGKKHQTKPPAFTESVGSSAPSLERVHVASFLRSIDRIFFSVGIDRGIARKRLPGEGKVIKEIRVHVSTADCHYGKTSRTLMLGLPELFRFQNSRRRNKERLRRTLTHRQRQNADGTHYEMMLRATNCCNEEMKDNSLRSNVILILKQSALSLACEYLASKEDTNAASRSINNVTEEQKSEVAKEEQSIACLTKRNCRGLWRTKSDNITGSYDESKGTRTDG
ncbi:hypothetical protein EAG_07401 [Camponotus floridanus]|uniref:Uncharacterized protein n=1 Tax=Camponotus floridanus TaxID=104421 RepID=E2ASF7_CAMFO|nr:hypothetical protein EAG_07401 [Camponotus floridanus]